MYRFVQQVSEIRHDPIRRGKVLDLRLDCGHVTTIKVLQTTNIVIGESRAQCPVCKKAEIERELAGA